LDVNGLEIKLQIQRGMTFLDLTLIFFIAAEKLISYGEKMGFRSVKNTVFKLSPKNRFFLPVFQSQFGQIKVGTKKSTVTFVKRISWEL